MLVRGCGEIGSLIHCWQECKIDTLFLLNFLFCTLEEGMTTPSSILSWKITWTEEPGGLQSMGSQRVGHDWSDLTYINMHFVLEHSWLTILWQFQVNSKGTQPYVCPFSPKPHSHPGCHMTLSRVPCTRQ